MSIRGALDKVRALNIQLPTLWYFEIPGSTELKYRVQSTTLSWPSLETQRNGARALYFSNYTEVEDFSVTFLETEDFLVTKWLEEWMDEIFDRRRKVFRNGNHTRRGLLSLQGFEHSPISLDSQAEVQASLSPQAQYRVNRSYVIEGMLLKSIGNKDLDYTSTEPYTVTATFAANTIRPSAENPGDARFT